MPGIPSFADDPTLLLRSHEYFDGLEDDVLEGIAEFVRVQHFETGDDVYVPHEPVSLIGFLVVGRVRVYSVDADGRESLFGIADPGTALGMNAAAMVEALPMGAVALEPTVVVALEYEDAFELCGRHPSMRRLWDRKRAQAVRAQLSIRTERKRRRTLTMFHLSPATRGVATDLVRRLGEIGERLGYFSDDDEPSADPGAQVNALVRDGRWVSSSELRREIVARAGSDRIVLDVDVNSVDPDRAASIMTQSHQLVWLVRPEDADAAADRIGQFVSRVPSLSDKTVIAWVLPDTHVAPVCPKLTQLASADFKISKVDTTESLGPAIGGGLDRLVHWLRGVRVGVALGGGAARGMAHLGVLKALERGGVPIDVIAGTSAGAMTGVMYGAGLDAEYLVERFVEDLRPGWFFRSIPRGGYWYMMYKYRRGQFDPMLRKYLENLQLEQLPIPCAAVAVDLVRGEAVVRETGDAVHAILDSINLPLLSKPNLRPGQALIDGGFVNNVPADVLVERGCNFVIAVDVLARIKQEFAGIRQDTPIEQARSPSSLQTMLRTYAVQSANMNSVGVLPADVRVEPDVSAFSMAAFTKAAEMAAIGDTTTTEQVDGIRKLLARLDSGLFQAD